MVAPLKKELMAKPECIFFCKYKGKIVCKISVVKEERNEMERPCVRKGCSEGMELSLRNIFK
jgi:hypothetical protein